MIFSSFEFILVFLPITWTGFVLLRSAAPAAWAVCWLLALSLVFYAWWRPQQLLILVASIAANYVAARAIFTATDARRARLLLIVAVVGNLLFLGYFKYFTWLGESFNFLVDGSLNFPGIVLPLAISFFTFQQVTYLLSVHRRELEPAPFLKYATFICFFPQLIAGPIVHHREFLPQFGRVDVRISALKLNVGVTIFVLGLAKKVLLADRLHQYFEIAQTQVSVHGVVPTLFDSWLLASTGAIRIYLDYSAYADMAVGLAIIFGFRLPVNFYSPFKATTISEFWRRWNITLMRFLRDSIYIPLGGGRGGWLSRSFAIGATMVLCGVWHGAGWNFVVWGGMNAVLVASEPLVVSWAGRFLSGRVVRRLLGRVAVFAGFVVPASVFLFPDFQDGMTVLRGMVGLNGVSLPLSVRDGLPWVTSAFAGVGVAIDAPMALALSSNQLLLLGVALLTIYALPNLYDLFHRFNVYATHPRTPDSSLVSVRWHPSGAWAVLTGALLAIALVHLYSVQEFYYFQF